MKKIYLIIVITLILATLSVYGCTSQPLVVQQSTTSVTSNAYISTTSAKSTKPFTANDRFKYQLITIQPEGNEASFSILPQQHYSVVLFVENKVTSGIDVYCTYIPSEDMANTIWINYFNPSDRGDPTTFGHEKGYNRTNFTVIVAHQIGWYTIDFYYDIPEGKLASSLPPVKIYARWNMRGGQ